MNTDCVEKINLSSIIRKVMSNESSDSQQISEEVGKVIRDTLQNKNIYDRIGDTTLREIYEHYTKINEKISLNIHPDYKEIGLSLVGYGLLVRTYNKLVYNRPLPTGFSVEEFNVIKTTRSFSRYWFTGFVIPLLLFSAHRIREKGNFVNVNVNLPEVNSSSLTDNNTTKNSGFGLFFLLKKKVNTHFPTLWVWEGE